MDILEAGGCVNCGRAVAGPDQAFCPGCGQPTPAHRIDWHYFGHELEHTVLHTDRGLLYSLKGLMLRPGRLMRDYVEGRRARQAKPLLLLMTLAAVVVFAGGYLLAGDVVGSAMVADDGGAGPEQPEAQRLLAAFTTVKDWMNHHLAAVTLLLLPLEALAFKLAFRKTGGLNYPEWLVITTFLTVQTFVLLVLSMPLQRVWPHAQAGATWLAILYGVVSLAQYFAGYPRWKSVLRALWGYALFMLLNGLLTFVVVVALLVSRPGG